MKENESLEGYVPAVDIECRYNHILYSLLCYWRIEWKLKTVRKEWSYNNDGE